MGWEDAPVVDKKSAIPAWSSAPVVTDKPKFDYNPRLSEMEHKVTSGAFVQEDPTVDYTGVNDPKKQAIYSLLSTPEEKSQYLKQEYGADNVTKSSYGQDVVIQNGKKIAFEPKGGLGRGNLISRTASLAGSVLPTAGMIAGGMVSGPGAILGAAGGAAGGEAVNKIIKTGLGLNLQTGKEILGDIGTEAAKGAAAEGIGQAARRIGRTVLAPYEPGSIFSPWKETLPRYKEQKAELEQALSYGFTPKSGVYAPRAGFIQAKQKVAQDVFGDPLALENKSVAERYRQGFIDRIGGGGQNPLDLNLSLSQKAEEAIKKAEADAGMAMVNAKKVIQQAQDKITGKIGRPVGNVQESLTNDVRSLKEIFNEQANGLYTPVDQYIGKPAVPTKRISDLVDSISEKRATTVSGQPVGQQTPMFDRIKQMPKYITFAQMQELRHELSSMSEAEALNAGVSAGRAKQLAGAANSAFDDAVSEIKSKVGEYGAKNVTKAVEALRYADAFYSDGIKKFQNLTITGIIKDATQHGNVQPEKITEYLVRPDQVNRLVQVKLMVKPETFQQVAAQHWERLLEKSTNPLTGEVEGSRLAGYLKGKENEIVFGNQVDDMRTLAKQLSSLNLKLDSPVLSTLPNGKSTQLIKSAIEKKQALDSLVKGNAIAAIREEGPQSIKAADYITEPNGLLRYRQAYSTFGAKSNEVKGLKEYLARRIFSTMDVPASSAAQRYTATELSGAPLKAELEKYGKPYLEEVMGKEWTKDAFDFANAAEIGMRPLTAVHGAGLVISGGMRTSPLSHKLLGLRYWAMGELWSKPTVIKYLSGGFSEGKVIDRIREIGDITTRTILPYEIETAPKEIKKKTDAILYRASAIEERARRKKERATQGMID